MKLQNEIKNHFGNYGFLWKESDPIVSLNQKLLFNISGGVVFEDAIARGLTPNRARISSIQTCLRTDGWEKIGTSGRHHLAFDMLGHFSLYENDERTVKNLMIESAWKLLIDCAGINSRNLFATVHPQDIVSQKIWEELGVKTISNNENVTFIPSKTKCGLRTEIVWQHPETMELREIWNLVFTQFHGNTLFHSPMEKIAADSGASIDRIVTLIEHRSSNYENSLWKQLVQSLESCSVKDSYTKVCRLADLGKAATLLVSQGLGPGNKAAEYVLRKIIREAYIICRQVSLPFKEFGLISSNYWISVETTRNTVLQALMKEVSKFEQSLVRGRREYVKLKSQKTGLLNEQDIKYLASTFGYSAVLIELDECPSRKELI